MESLDQIIARARVTASQRNITSQSIEKVYECSKCQDRELIPIIKDGIVYAEPCTCKQQKKLNRLLKSSGLTDEQRALTFGMYKPTGATQEMFDTCFEYVKEFRRMAESTDRNKGIWLSGTVGVGKTHLLLAIVNNLLSKSIQTVFVYTPNLMGELKDSQFKEGSFEEKIAKLSQVPVVAFDDLGKEKITQWVQNQYDRIINERYERRLPTLFSSNHDLDRLADLIGDASASRIYSMTKERQFHVEAEDYRIK